MPPVAELTALEVKRFEGPGFYAVGGVTGLYLKIAPGGSRSWILRATVGTKRKDIGLGGFPDVPLTRAREKARAAREMIWAGTDPISHRKAAKLALKIKQTNHITFRQAASRCHASKSPEFRNDKHRKDWIATLERHAFPILGDMPVSGIGMPQVLQVLEPIWHTKTETATRVRQRIEAVLSWSTVSGFRSGENPARWDANLKEVLPNPGKIAKVVHHPALPWQDVPQFMKELRKREGNSARALEVAILTASRSSEARGMLWPEINFETKIWTVPPERIKAGKEHKVPLSDEVFRIIENQPRIDGVQLVFPAPRGAQLSDMALLQTVRRMGAPAVPHGFRSSFKDWARSCTAYPDEVSELALAHVNSDATRAAYARDELLPQREKMMKDWAKFCLTLPNEEAKSQERSI
ncbi:MAG: integrase arm-type DNA-binding domain-containing protein [Gammaproteobacteria bacterium]|nr:integrase arm-type DNA-binding domain-containing protein [Gammaproteobacteria bacterium]